MVAPGTVLAGRYEVRRTLSGDTLYAATDRLLGEQVALKLGATTEADRLRTEARMARRISHPNVLRVHDLCEVSEGTLLVMELVEGTPLDQVAQGGMLRSRALDVIRQIGAGLSAVHRAGIVHGGVTPKNILVAGTRVVLAGFGGARMGGGEGERGDLTQLTALIRLLLPDPPEAVLARAFESADALVAAVLAHVGPTAPPKPTAPALPKTTSLSGPLVDQWAPPLVGGTPTSLLHRGARRLATVLHVLVAAAPSGEDVDEEKTEEQLEGLLYAAEVAVADVGGAVVARGTQALTGVFGGRASTGDDPARAADAARAILAATQGGQLSARLGIDTGRLLVKDQAGTLSVTGDPLRGAEKLAAAASPGEVLASKRSARHLAARFRIEPTTRGVRVHKRRPPGEVAAIGSAPIFGRDREIEKLVGHLATARDGQARAALVTGPPGIGKSRLRREVVTILGARAGFRILAASARPDDAHAPYAVIRALFSGLGDVPEAAREAQHALVTPTANVAAVPAVAAARIVLAETARQKPLLLVVDDVQWADDASLTIVAALAAGDLEAPIAVLLMGRPEALERRAWPASILTLELAPLGAEFAAEIAAHQLGGEIDPARLGKLVAAADGNPFFVEELARDLQERGLGSWDAAVPTTVEETIQARLDRLPDDARAVLRAAAVLGRRFERADLAALLAEIAPDQADQLDELLGRLEDRQLAFPTGGEADDDHWTIKHYLVRDVAYAELVPSVRRALHATAARLAEARATVTEGGARVELLVALAGHRDGAEDRAGAATTYEQAGRLAIEVAAFGDAYQCLLRARALAGEQASFELLLALGEVTRDVGDLEDAEQTLLAALARAEATDARLDMTRALRGLGKVSSLRSRFQQAIERAERGLAVIGELDPAIAASLRLDLGWVSGYALGETTRGLAEARAAVALLEGRSPLMQGRGDSVELARGYDCLAAIHLRCGMWREQLAWNLRNLAISERIGSASLLLALTNVGENYRNLGDGQRALDHTRRALLLSEKMCMTRHAAYARKNLALIYTDLLVLDDAERELAEALRLSELAGWEYWRVDADYIAARLAARRGDLPKARRHAEDGIERARSGQSPIDEGIGHKYLGELWSLSGLHDHAARELDRAEAILQAKDLGEAARTLAARGRALLRRGDPGAAAVIAEARQALEALGAAHDVAALEDLAYV